ncbi:FAD/NAD(P)-binding domain-containing protein [Hypomontagnella submonticulosa]|nr:FAD/NAD(P)-binding domain-containing protein [Hypomontagnella submonticulosa]
MTQMKVLISGGGIAGNALAFWLSKLGHDVTVVEWFPNLRTTGLQLDLRGHGIEVMKRMGLEQDFRTRMAPEQGLQIVNSAGKRRAFFPANRSGKGLQSFTTDWEIMRGDLCRLLYDHSKDRTKYIFGTSVESFEEKDDGIEVRLSNGNMNKYDLLVGADGQGSRTRRMMLGQDGSDGLHPLHGVYIAYFIMPRPKKEDEEYLATVYTATGRRAMMIRRHNPDEVQVYLMCKNDSEQLKKVRKGDINEEKKILAEIFKDAGWHTEEILRSMMVADDFYLEHLGLVKLDSWSRGRITLLGDAAYCPTASTGMGTTSALVGAYVLAGEIGRHCKDGTNTEDGLTAALKAYDEKFRPFMDQVQKGISEDSGAWGSMMPSTAFGIGVMNFLMGMAALLRLNIIAEWFLKEGVKWDLPEYEEILRAQGVKEGSRLPTRTY